MTFVLGVAIGVGLCGAAALVHLNRIGHELVGDDDE